MVGKKVSHSHSRTINLRGDYGCEELSRNEHTRRFSCVYHSEESCKHTHTKRAREIEPDRIKYNRKTKRRTPGQSVKVNLGGEEVSIFRVSKRGGPLSRNRSGGERF